MTGEGLRVPVKEISFETELKKEGAIWSCKKEQGEQAISCLFMPEDLIVALTVESVSLDVKRQIVNHICQA